MATYSSILAWEIPWTEGLMGYSPWECRRVRHNLATEQQQHDILSTILGTEIQKKKKRKKRLHFPGFKALTI